MEMKNAKSRSRSSEVRSGSKRSQLESESRSMGTISGIGREFGDDKVRASREDSNKSNTFVAREGVDGIGGKIARQLIDETKKQLAYHQQQVEVLSGRLQELEQITETSRDTDKA